MSLADKLAALGNPANTTTYSPKFPSLFKHPQGWEPGVSWNGKEGTAISRPMPADQEADHAALLEEWGFDPKTHMIDGPLEYRQWDANVGEGEIKTLRYYKARIIRGKQLAESDVEALMAEIRSHKPVKNTKVTGDDAFCVFLSDWQIGKGEGGGTPATVGRLLHAADAVEQRIKELRKVGRPLGSLYVFGIGDLLEGCSGFYCVAADTPILTDDLRWVPAGDLRAGDGLYALNEEQEGPRGRRFEKAQVLQHEVKELPAVKVTFSNGDSITCTPEHPFLARPVRVHGAAPYRWVEAKDLMTGRYEVAKMMNTWETGNTRAHGYLAGLYDGEGHLFAGTQRGGPNILGLSQKPGVVLDEAKALLSSLGFTHTESKNAKSGVHTLRQTGGYPELLRFLGTIRPERLINKIGTPWIRAMETPEVISVEDVGIQRIAVMGTTSHTYFAGGYASHNTMQEFQTDLNRRDQFQAVVRLLVQMLRQWSRHFERVVVTGVGGNHGENRKSGRAFTDFADNDDVAVFETAALIMAENPEVYGHVSFVIPQDRLTVVLDVAGVNVGVVHGHQFSRGGRTAQAKAEEWWKSHTFGLQPVADATILVSAHYHHFSVVEHGHRVHFQTPAMDGGSAWWTELSGAESPAGILTLRIDATGWSDLAIMR